MPARHEDNYLNLPRPPFMWTVDQIAQIVGLSENVLTNKHIFYQNLTSGPHPKSRLLAHNIAELGETPVWRITESELTRWLLTRGFRPRYNAWH